MIMNCVILTYNDVIILFHEFGHVLHHIMTRVDILEIFGEIVFFKILLNCLVR